MDELRYPVGRHDPSAPVTPDQVRKAVEDIRDLPGRLAEAVRGLDDAQLDTPYRPEGWTVRQVVHHVVDSHVNAYVRLRLALTEDRPPIRGYHQELWAELPTPARCRSSRRSRSSAASTSAGRRSSTAWIPTTSTARSSTRSSAPSRSAS